MLKCCPQWERIDTYFNATRHNITRPRSEKAWLDVSRAGQITWISVHELYGMRYFVKYTFLSSAALLSINAFPAVRRLTGYIPRQLTRSYA